MAVTRLKGRYEKRAILGEGGMGVVYRAYDVEVPRDVALKTIREAHDLPALEMFRRECTVLAKLQHPNIVDLYDFGDFEEDGQTKPYFVMPLLPGVTFDKLIHNTSIRLTVERVVEIISQACRGLQAAHDRGLVHRDIKPTNIFVLEDDSVKLIDFGVAHLVGNRTTTGVKGTLSYMSPEQIQMGQPAAASDIFSLAVVCYEALTRRRPFTGTREDEVARAILSHIPPAASDLNPAVNLTLSQVLHAAMAKKPENRTPSARQFADELQRAVHNQPIDRFNSSRVEPRIRRAQKALEDSEYEFAAEILSELEVEGHLHPQLRSLRTQVDRAIRETRKRQLLETARRRLENEEYGLALQRVEEVLQLDSEDSEALSMRRKIEAQRKTQQVGDWFGIAEQYMASHAYDNAREAIRNILQAQPADTRAHQLMSEADHREREYLATRKEKEEVFQIALDCWHRGEVTAARSKLERVLELDRRAPDVSASGPYQSFYSEVCAEQEAIAGAHARGLELLSQNAFTEARAICEQYLKKYPSHALFRALQFDIGEGERHHLSEYVAEIDRKVEAEPDLDRRVAILTEALTRHPGESHFQHAMKVVTDRRDFVDSIVRKARNLEDRGQYSEALAQWETLRTIYARYSGLDNECARVAARQEQQVRADDKSSRIERIRAALAAGDFSETLRMVAAALAEFPEDAQLTALQSEAQSGLAQANQAAEILQQGAESCAQGDFDSGLRRLWEAHRLARHSSSIRAVLTENLLKHAAASAGTDRSAATALVRQALELDPLNSQARTLQASLANQSQDVPPRPATTVSHSTPPQDQPAGGARMPADQPRPEVPSVDWNATRMGSTPPQAASPERPRAVTTKPPAPVIQETATRPEETGTKPIAGRADGSRTMKRAVAAIAAVVLLAAGGFAAWATLRPAPDIAAFEAEVEIRTSVPGARLLVNNEERGAAPVTLRLAEGQYQIEAILEGYQSAGPVQLVVSRDRVVAPVDIALEPMPQPAGGVDAAVKTGWIQFNVSPADSKISWQRENESESGTARTGERVEMREGRYVVTASAGTYPERREVVIVTSGVESPLNWDLAAADLPSPQSGPASTARVVGFDGLQGVLEKDAEGWVRTRSPFTLFKENSAGTVSFHLKFTGVLRKRAYWIANYVDDRNYVQFEIDNSNIRATVVANGRERSENAIIHGMTAYENYYALSIQIKSNAVTFNSLKNAQYVPFYSWTAPQNTDLLKGKFGFRDEVLLRGFQVAVSQ